MKNQGLLEKNASQPRAGFLIYNKNYCAESFGFNEIIWNECDINKKGIFLDKIFDGLIRLVLG